MLRHDVFVKFQFVIYITTCQTHAKIWITYIVALIHCLVNCHEIFWIPQMPDLQTRLKDSACLTEVGRVSNLWKRFEILTICIARPVLLVFSYQSSTPLKNARIIQFLEIGDLMPNISSMTSRDFVKIQIWELSKSGSESLTKVLTLLWFEMATQR